MLRPVDIADLVPDQCVGGRSIGHAQQCFGKAHECYALFGGKTILLEESVDPACLPASRTFDQPTRKLSRLGMFCYCRGCLLHTFRHTRVFFCAIRFAQPLARDRGKADRIIQSHTTPWETGFTDAGHLDLMHSAFKLCECVP